MSRVPRIALPLLSLMLLLGATAAQAIDRDDHITRGEAARFDRYLDSHPNVARDLRRDPRLIDNRQFVQNHPELHEFLRNHPEVREDIREHPRAFMNAERRYERHEGREGWRRN